MNDTKSLHIKIKRSTQEWGIDDTFFVNQLNDATSAAIEDVLIKVIERGAGFDIFVHTCIGSAITQFVLPLTNDSEVLSKVRIFIFRYFGKTEQESL